MKTFARLILLIVMISLLLLFTTSCGNWGGIQTISTIKHDDCEFVVAERYNGGIAIIHKPLCSNPAHDEEDNEFATPERLTSK